MLKDLLKKKWRELTVIVACAIAVIITSIVYSVFTNNHIFKESADHLEEIYEQLNTRVYKQIEDDRSLLKSWTNYINNSMRIINDDKYDSETRSTREDEFELFMAEQKKEWGFSDFYFIKSSTLEEEERDEAKTETYKYEYSYVSPFAFPLSQEGNIDESQVSKIMLRRNLRLLLNDENDGGVVGIIKDAEGNDKLVMIFAIRIDPATTDSPNPDKDIKYIYRGFQFAAIGMCFDTDKMLSMLDVDVFGDRGEFYVTLEDGVVLLQSGGKTKENYLDYLRSGECKISKKSIAQIEADWNHEVITAGGEPQQKGTFLIDDKTDGKERYVTYMPIGFGDWMLVGSVPSSVVNGSMSWFRTVTVIVMAALFVVIAAAIAWMLIVIQKRRVKEKELEVKSRENLLDLLTANTNDIFILFSTENFAGDYVSANIKHVLGLDPEVVAKDVRTVLKSSVEEHAAFTAEGLGTLPVGNKWETDIEMRNAETDTNYWFRLMVYRSSYQGKDSYIMMFSDRTQERKMSNNLKQALSVAKSANAAKSNFLSNMSHDIRTPMNAIIGYSTLLAKDADKPDKVREYIRKIAFSGQHLLSLINDILDMSKIESGKTTLNLEEFNLSELLEEIYAMTSAQTKAKKQTFEVHTKGHMPEIVRGDKLRINQVLLNLLSNAIKYTPEGGDIDLLVESLDKKIQHHCHLRIEVKDNGIGMSEEFVKTVFDPFSREVTADTREIQGTGLGMAITKNIVDLMGGTIRVDSKLGKGSKFTIELELAVADKVSYDEDFWKHNNVTNILVVDDEEEICLDIRELMRDTGVKVDYALSGMKAVEMVTEACENHEDYHIVLLDWKMPEMDGVETAKRIRAKVGRDVPIMVLTSYSFDEIEGQAKDAGIDYFMPKPFFVSNFRNAIVKIRDTGKQADSPKSLQGISLKGLKVLAAEDNEINAEILTELLEIEEVECEIASDGKEALEKFESAAPGRYDLIFMDVQMPIMNGYEATKAIRTCKNPEAKTIPIIAMTANAFDDDVRMALDSGMNAHLAKPINMDKLKDIIQDLLGDRNEDR